MIKPPKEVEDMPNTEDRKKNEQSGELHVFVWHRLLPRAFVLEVTARLS